MQLNKRQKTRKTLIYISFFLFPITIFYLSPALPFVGLFKGIINGSLIVFGLLFIFSLFFGRAFCSWVCPGAGAGEICSSILPKKTTKAHWLKWFVWVPWVALFTVLAILYGNYKSIDFLMAIPKGISILNPEAVIIYYIILSLMVILSFTTDNRGFCHYVCWMSPFMIIGNKIRYLLKYPSLHLNAESEKCTSCLQCTKACQMSIDVNRMVKDNNFNNSDCILCGLCVDNCSEKIIRYSFKSIK